MRVFVYYNLHKHCFSVKSLEGETYGKVIAHRPSVVIRNATFKVSETGRQRVLKEQRKNVHAGVVGTWIDGGRGFNGTMVTYNPYKYKSFVFADSEEPIFEATKVFLKDKKVMVKI
jgi:hypothetical protein